MKDPTYAMQAAVYAKLAAFAGLATAMGGTARVYDKVPAEPGYPYARIGDDQAVGDSNSCADGWEVYCTVHTFSRNATAPRPEAKAIQNQIALAIGDNASLPAASGLNVVEVELEQSRTFMEADGITAHGVLTFKYLVADT